MSGETTVLLDTCVVVACGRAGSSAYEALERRAKRNGTPYEIPPRVYEELGGTPDTKEYDSPSVPVEKAIRDGWMAVTRSPDYTNPTVSTLMDQARRFIASETGQPEDMIEKADTALVGIAAGRLDSGKADRVEVYTGDKPAGRAIETLLPKHGFDSERIVWVDGNEFVRHLREESV
jgi:hypothetical protein